MQTYTIKLFGKKFKIKQSANGKFIMPDSLARWKDRGTSLKPAFEPIIVAMKPLEGTYAQNAEKYGVAGLNIEGARIKTKDTLSFKFSEDMGTGNSFKWADTTTKKRAGTTWTNNKGRWPANLILDEEAGAMLDEQSGMSKSVSSHKIYKINNPIALNKSTNGAYRNFDINDSGGASRFFYCAKTSKKERNFGLEKIKGTHTHKLTGRKQGSAGQMSPYAGIARDRIVQNIHPTVKPLKLMEYLCTLTKTPTGGIVLDPFAGTGTTGMACKLTARHFIGIELDKEYCKIAKLRMKATKRRKPKNGILKKKIFKTQSNR